MSHNSQIITTELATYEVVATVGRAHVYERHTDQPTGSWTSLGRVRKVHISGSRTGKVSNGHDEWAPVTASGTPLEQEPTRALAVTAIIEHHEKALREAAKAPAESGPPCSHAESLWGRCTACGMTWDEQAEAAEAADHGWSHCQTCGRDADFRLQKESGLERFVCFRHLLAEFEAQALEEETYRVKRVG